MMGVLNGCTTHFNAETKFHVLQISCIRLKYHKMTTAAYKTAPKVTRSLISKSKCM